MEVDTFSYDNELMQIWQNMCGADEIFDSYDEFYNYMAEFLV
jgi:hypothetical protein